MFYDQDLIRKEQLLREDGKPLYRLQCRFCQKAPPLCFCGNTIFDDSNNDVTGGAK